MRAVAVQVRQMKVQASTRYREIKVTQQGFAEGAVEIGYVSYEGC